MPDPLTPEDYEGQPWGAVGTFGPVALQDTMNKVTQNPVIEAFLDSQDPEQAFEDLGIITETTGDLRYAAKIHTHPDATISASGFLSSDNFNKLGALTAGSTSNTLSLVNIDGISGGIQLVKPSTGRHLLVRNRTPNVSTGIHIEPNGYIDQGTVAKTDWMFDPFNDDQVNYRIGNLYTKTGSGAGFNGQNGVYVIGAKGVGDHFGVFPSINIGFGDDSVSGGGVLKVFLFDTTDTVWRTPMEGAWRAGRTATTGDYMLANNKLYQATTTGTTGGTKPSHTSGTVSDGAVDWLFVRDYTGGVGFKPVVVIGNREDMPYFGHIDTRLQLHADTIVKNGKKIKFLNNTANVPLATWDIGNGLNTTDFNITNLGAVGGALRFNQAGWFQLNGLAQIYGSKAATNLSPTPDISKTSLLRVDNTSATTITAFTGGYPYQHLVVHAGNGNTTLQHSASIVLLGAQNRTLAAGDTLHFMMASSGTVAYQVLGERPVTSAIQAPGVTGAVTQNTNQGRVNFAAAAASLVVTNSFVTVNSLIHATKATNDSTARLGAPVPGAGFFTIYMDVPPAAECAVNWIITAK